MALSKKDVGSQRTSRIDRRSTFGFIVFFSFLYILWSFSTKKWPWTTSQTTTSTMDTVLEFESVEGYFMQDDPKTDSSDFDFRNHNFGLIERKYDTDEKFDPERKKTQWQRFEEFVNHLNHTAPDGTIYKVLFLGRHGEGYHNVAEKYYGTPEWDRYWSKLEGNGTSNWTDASLTPVGIDQAKEVNSYWRNQMKDKEIPMPQTYYASPLARCLQTAFYTFDGLDFPRQFPFRPLIKELLREVIGEHTCDKRSSQTWIHEHYPDWPIEDGFTESDELWSPDYRETSKETVSRLKKLLTDIFQNDGHTFLSLTSHSGAIAAILTCIRHRNFALKTGAVIPVFIKAKRNSR